MATPCAEKRLRERALEPLQFDLRSEVDLPDFPLLCILTRRGERVEAMINTAFGKRGYLHAAWHTEHWTGETLICQLGEPCGYDGET